MKPPVALILRNGAVLGLTAGLAELFHLPEGLFMVLAALMTLEGSIGQGQVAGRERIAGTLCGTAVCLLVLGLLQWHGVPAAVLGLGLVRVMGHGLGLTSGFIVGGHVVAGSVAHHTADWSSYVLMRSLETVLGVLVGMLAARWVLPVRASHQLKQAVERWCLDLAEALRQPQLDADLLQRLRQRRDQLLDQRRFAREEINAGPRAQAQASCWDQQLFHGSALLGCLRDLSALAPPPSDDLGRVCRAVRIASARRLERGGDGGPLWRAQGQLERCCEQLEALGLGGQDASWDDDVLDQLALRIHRTRSIGRHADTLAALGATADGDQRPLEMKRSIR